MCIVESDIDGKEEKQRWEIAEGVTKDAAAPVMAVIRFVPQDDK